MERGGQNRETACARAEISDFISNIAIADPVARMAGDPIVGIIGATYGAHLTSQLERRRPRD